MSTVAQRRACAYTSPTAQHGAPDAHAPGIVPLLMETMQERIAGARGRLATGDERESVRLVQGALRVAGQLRGHLDLLGEDPFAAHLYDMYEYVSRRLAPTAGHGRFEALEEVADLLREMQCAWAVISHGAASGVRPVAA